MDKRRLLLAGILLTSSFLGCGPASSQAEPSRQNQTDEETRFEYLVCQEQAGRVTWVNEVWNGDKAGDLPTDEEQETCPWTWEFLNERGLQGWKLVSVVAVHTVEDEIDYDFRRLYLVRPLP